MQKSRQKYLTGLRSDNRAKGDAYEKLAQFLLSFVSHATKIQKEEDVGIDFICTLYEILTATGGQYQVPNATFAIQIKPNKENIEIPYHRFNYFNDLGVPFFIGVINIKELTMEIYSTHQLINVFLKYGHPRNATIHLKFTHYHKKIDLNNRYQVPLGSSILELGAKTITTLQVRKNAISTLKDWIYLAEENIASSKTGEFITRIRYEEKSKLKEIYKIYHGSGSEEYLYEGLAKRLAMLLFSLIRKKGKDEKEIYGQVKGLTEIVLGRLKSQNKTESPGYKKLQELREKAKKTLN